MKKIFQLLIGILVIIGIAICPVYAASNFYGAIALTGGASGSVDSIDGTNLATGDGLYCITSTGFYIYYLNATSGAAESSPDVISPDDNAGNKRWILIFMGDPETAEIAQLAVTDGNIIVGDGATWVAESGATARTSLGVGTGDSPQFTGIELGAATDTTLTRTGAGDASIEGKAIYRADGTDVADADVVDDLTVTSTKKISTLLTTEQLRLSYDALNYAAWTVAADGALTITTVDNAAAEADINFNPDGFVGIKTAVPTVELDVTGSIKASGTISAATYGSDGSITDAELLGIDNGLTTQIPVGGGAGVGMVWTTATGTGAPVRAGSPTMTGVPLAPTIGLSNLTNLKVPKHVDDATGLADTTITVSANNEVTNASQPSFLAYNSVTDANVTGDGTPFTVIFDAEVFDQNANFDGTSTFTAPVTGKYRFTAVVLLGELAANHTSLELYINTSNRDYYHYGVGSIALQQAVSVSVLADMDATDTAVITVAVTGGSIVVDVIGGAGTDHFTYFCGELVN